MLNSDEVGSAARLDGLDLGEVDGGPAKAGGQLGQVEEVALGGSDGAQFGAGGAADAALGADRLLQRAVLLGVVAVGAEGGVAGPGVARVAVGAERLGEAAGGRGRVRLGSVVDGSWGERR